jgi:hypothetical protein
MLVFPIVFGLVKRSGQRIMDPLPITDRFNGLLLNPDRFRGLSMCPMNRLVRKLSSHLFTAMFVALWIVACLLSPLSDSDSSRHPVDHTSVSGVDAACLLYSEPSNSQSLNRLCQTNWDAEYPSGGLLSLEISRKSSDEVLRALELSHRFPLVTPMTLGVVLRL